MNSENVWNRLLFRYSPGRANYREHKSLHVNYSVIATSIILIIKTTFLSVFSVDPLQNPMRQQQRHPWLYFTKEVSCLGRDIRQYVCF